MAKRITESALALAVAGVLAIGVVAEIGGPVLATFDSISATYSALNAR